MSRYVITTLTSRHLTPNGFPPPCRLLAPRLTASSTLNVSQVSAAQVKAVAMPPRRDEEAYVNVNVAVDNESPSFEPAHSHAWDFQGSMSAECFR